MSEIPRAQVVRGAAPDRERAAAAAGASPPPSRVLRLAPRKVPAALRRRMLLGGPIARFGWLFAAAGMVIVLVVLPRIDLGLASYDGEASATVVAVEPTISDEDSTQIYRVRYTFFDAAAALHRGASYTETAPAVRASVPVHYRSADPSASRLEGMRARPYPRWGLLALGFPLVGLALALAQLRGAMRDLRLLRFGEVTHGRLVAKRETRVSYNDVPVMALEFAYEVDGEPHTATVKTLTPELLEDDEREAMIYDPRRPEHATTLDHLPGSPSLSSDGELVAPPGWSFHLLIMPAVFVCLVIATVIELR